MSLRGRGRRGSPDGGDAIPHGRGLRRRPLVVGAAVLVAGALAVAAFADRGRSSSGPVSAAQARAAAEVACRDLATFDRELRANSSGSEVFRALDHAVKQAEVAQRGDVEWVQLWSSLRFLRYSLERDDGPAARRAHAVAGEACAPIREQDRPPDDTTPTTLRVP